MTTDIVEQKPANVSPADGANALPRAVHDAEALHDHRFRYYDFAMAAFVAVLICSNLIGAAKLVQVFDFTVGGFQLGIFGAGVLFFPLSYVLGDVLTEVYGYARAPGRLDWLCGRRLYGLYVLGGGDNAPGAGLGRPARL